MSTVFYNFPEILLSLEGMKSPSSQEIQLSNVGQPLTNIQLNNVNYSAKSILIASSPSSSSTPGHLIIKCYADPNDTTSNLIFVAIPLTVEPPNGSGKQTLSDVDSIINASGGEMIKLTLNNYIKPNGGCVVPPSPNFPLTITLDSTSAIPVKQYTNNTKFYPVGSVNSLSVNPNPRDNKNALLKQQDLDWIMTCELLTEDGPTEKTSIDPNSTATTISLLAMSIVIAGATYMASPMLYKELGIFKYVNERLGGNHYSMNVYWYVNLAVTGFLCFIQGIQSTESIYYFISFALFLSYYSGTLGILKLEGVSNPAGNDFAKKDNPYDFYNQIFSKECGSNTGLIIKGISIALFFYPLLTLIVAIGVKEDALFFSHIFIFLFFAMVLFGVVKKFNK